MSSIVCHRQDYMSSVVGGSTAVKDSGNGDDPYVERNTVVSHVLNKLSLACSLFTKIHCIVSSLLVLGMDHYGPSAWSLIQENLLPTKTVKQVTPTYMYICPVWYSQYTSVKNHRFSNAVVTLIIRTKLHNFVSAVRIS